ncbi:MAG: DinB family protein [Caldilineaceae bacterium]
MTPAYFQELYDFNYWNNHRVWQCLLPLTEAQVQQPTSEEEWSIFVHCLHIIGVEEWWVHFLQTGELHFLEWDAFPDLASLHTQWDATEAMVRAYVAALTPDELQREVRPSFWEVEQGPIKVYQALTQVALHSGDHRAQILTHIRNLGGATVEQDFLGYLFRKANPQK